MTARKPSSWRKRAAKRIADRDGAACAKCGCADRLIVRRGSVSGRYCDGDFFSIVHITSCLELDHIRPLSEGGDNEDANLWLLCVDCHKAKTIAERSARLKRLFAEARA
jgi:5-methylcytosine-specific restriction endonuclease McrA